MKPSVSLLLLTALFAAHGAARAEPPATPPLPGMGPGMSPPAFADFDRDGDGFLTEQELLEGRAERIRARSQQGYPMRNLPNAPSFTDLDRDGDGRLSPEEWRAGSARHAPPGGRGPRLDHDEVKQLRDSRQILPMEALLGRAQALQPGQLIEAELEQKRGRYCYEIKLLAADGRVHKLYLDATTGELLERKER